MEFIDPTLESTGDKGTAKDVFKVIDADLRQLVTRPNASRPYVNLGLTPNSRRDFLQKINDIDYSGDYEVTVTIDDHTHSIGAPEDFDALLFGLNQLQIGWFDGEDEDSMTVEWFHLMMHVTQNDVTLWTADDTETEELENIPTAVDIIKELALRVTTSEQNIINISTNGTVVYHDATLTGDGTINDPLSVVGGGGGVSTFSALTDAYDLSTAGAFTFPMNNSGQTALIPTSIFGGNVISVTAATTAALAANTYNNGASGVGATITITATGALAAQDGVTLIAGNTLLVKNEVDQTHNGPYTITNAGGIGVQAVLTRLGSADTDVELTNQVVIATQGNNPPSGNKGVPWLQQTDSPVIGTDPIDYDSVVNPTGAGRAWRTQLNAATSNGHRLGTSNNWPVDIYTVGTVRGHFDTSGNLDWGSASQFLLNSTGRITKYNNAAPTDGQVLIGDTAAGYFKAATLIQGANITITPGAGTITIAATGGGGAALSAITAGVGTNTIDSTAFKQEWQWSTLAGTDAFKLSSTSTLATGNTQVLFNLALSGTNATSAQTTYGAKISNTHAGTTSSNVALQLTASGGTTDNYALITTAGRVGINIAVPTSLLHVKGIAASTGKTILVQNSAGTNLFQVWDDGTFAMGYNTTPTWLEQVLIGYNATANNSGIAVGAIANASGASSTAVGYHAISSGTQSLSLGGSIASGTASIAIGGSTASALDAISVGELATSSAAGAITMGGSNQGGYANNIAGSFMIGLSPNVASQVAANAFFVYNTSNVVLESRFALAAANIGTHFDIIATNTHTIHSGYQPSAAITVTSVTSSSGAVFNYASNGNLVTGDKVVTSGFGVYNNQTYYLRTVSLTTAKLYTTRANSITDTSAVAFISTDTGTITPQPRSPVQVIADAAQLYTFDNGAGNASLWGLYENGMQGMVALIEIKTDTGDPTGYEGRLVINLADNTFRGYLDGAWRPLTAPW